LGGMRNASPYVQKDAAAVDLTPWKPARIVGAVLIVTVLAIYISLR
jgi:SSS family solute:Na+ symporter